MRSYRGSLVSSRTRVARVPLWTLEKYHIKILKDIYRHSAMMHKNKLVSTITHILS